MAMRRRLVAVVIAAGLALGFSGVLYETYYDMGPTRAPAVPVAETYYDMTPTHH